MTEQLLEIARQRDEWMDQFLQVSRENADLKQRLTASEAGAAAMRRVLHEIVTVDAMAIRELKLLGVELPNSSSELVQKSKAALASDAGRKTLTVLEAADGVLAACRMVLDDPGLTASANDVIRAAIAAYDASKKGTP